MVPTSKKKVYKVLERISRMSYSIVFRIFLKVFNPKFFRIFFKKLTVSSFWASKVAIKEGSSLFQEVCLIMETYLFQLAPTVAIIYKAQGNSIKKYLFKQFFLVKPKFIYLGVESTLSFGIKFMAIDFTVFFRKLKFGKVKEPSPGLSLFVYALLGSRVRMPGAIFKKYIMVLFKKRSSFNL